ncbi:hypothetical protein PG993_001702 [Apiospora rasikravindrae]|uniref:WKF domain-containing protein n=1 Tax=Apiospora rasikravindrae TaxID=990691 RepID=A0ABR1UC62_9PEZI
MSSSVPAWKRLGLTLKPASSESHGDSNTPTASLPVNGAKRKPSAALASDHTNKKVRTDNSTASASPAHTSKTPKTVSFASEAQTSSGTPTATKAKPANAKQKKATAPKPLKPQAKKQSNVNLQPSVDYLRQWHTARDQWKFNKNHQTKLLENVFADGATIPAVDINLFYEYIRDLKGHVRTRLRESAQELKNEDIEQGAQVFANSSKEAAQRKQKEYEEVIAGFMREGRAPEKRRFEEVEYVLRTADMEMQRRVVKRMRAEMVIEELSDGEESTTTTATTNTSTATETGAGAAEDSDGDKRMKLNDGSQQKVPKRTRKTRTAVVEDSSSSDSDSDSDADSSSSDESSSDDEEGAATAAEQDEAETSSSSSSSSSEDDSDTEEEESDAE